MPNYTCATSTFIDQIPFVENGVLQGIVPGQGLQPNERWYRFVPDDDGTVTISTVIQNVNKFNYANTLLELYSGSCNSLTILARNNDYVDRGYFSQITEFSASRGENYFIKLSGYQRDVGPYRITVTASFQSVNDLPAQNVLMTGPLSDIGPNLVNPQTYKFKIDGVHPGVTITPSIAGGGYFDPPTLTLNSNTLEARYGTIVYHPDSEGTKVLSVANNGGLINPATRTLDLHYPPGGIDGIKSWLRGDLTGLTADASVTTWTDLTGFGFNATQTVTAAKPVVKSGIANGKSVVRFTSASKMTWGTTPVGYPYTIVAVFSRNGGAGNYQRAVQGTNNWLIGPYQDKIRMYADGWVTNESGPSVVNGTFYRTLVTNDGIGNRFYINNTDYSENFTTTGVPGQLGLGSQGLASDQPLIGDIAELILVNHILTTAERNALEAYFLGRYYYTAPASAISISGPLDGAVGASSQSFAISTNGTIASNITVTPSDNGAGGIFTPASINYTQYTLSGSFTYIPSSIGPKSITLTNTGGLTNPAALTFTAYNDFPVPNASFEFPVIGDNNYQYNPQEPNQYWNYDGTCGLTTGSSFSLYAAPPDGKQVAFIQQGSTISQVITGMQPGSTYTVRAFFSTRNGSDPNQISCYFDNTKIGSTYVSTTSWVEKSFASFVATSTSHTLKFSGLANNGDITTYVDKVKITYISAGPATTFNLSGNIGNWIANTEAKITLTLNGLSSGVTVTPTISGETVTPTTLFLSTANPIASFYCTPTTIGTKSITFSNNGGLTNPTSSLIVRIARGNVAKDLYLWLANGGITSSVGSTQSTWSDWSIYHRDAVQTTAADRPTVNQSGAKYLTFDGNGDKLISPYSKDYNSSDRTLFILVRINSLSQNQYNRAFIAQDEGYGGTRKWIWSYGDSGGQVFHNNYDGGNYGEVYSNVWTRDTTKFYLLTIRKRGPAYYFYKGGTSDGISWNGIPCPNPNADVVIGYAESATFSGDIAEVLYYNRSLSDNEVLSVQRELASVAVPQSTESVIEPYEIVTEPWESYANNAAVRTVWTLSNTSDSEITPSTTQAYAGTKSLLVTAGNTAQKTFSSHVYWTAKFWLYIAASKLVGDGGILFSIAAPGANVGNPTKITHESDGTLKIYVGSNQIIQSSKKLNTSGWHKIEFKMKLIPDGNYTMPAGTPSANSIYSSDEDASKGFDSLSTTRWTTNGTSSGWLQYQFSTPTRIGKYKVACRNDYDNATAPKNWTLLGSNDGSTWTTLNTQTNQITWAYSESRLYTIASPAMYTYYRINVTANNGSGYLSIGELQLITLDGTFQVRIDGSDFITSPSTGLSVRSTNDNYTQLSLGTGLQVSGAGTRYIDEVRIDAGSIDFIDPPLFKQTDFYNPAYTGPVAYFPTYAINANSEEAYSGPVACFFAQPTVNAVKAYSGLVTYLPPAEPSSKHAFSGLVPFFAPPASTSNSAFYGWITVVLDTSKPPTSKHGYSGVTYVLSTAAPDVTSKAGLSGVAGPFAYYENGRYVWDLDFQFTNMNGNIQRGNDQATLKRTRTLPTDLAINNYNFYYRFDTTGLANLNPVGSPYDATTNQTTIDSTGLTTGTTVAQVTTGTITTTTTIVGNTTPNAGLAGSQVTYLSTANNVNSFVMGADITVPSTSNTNKTLYGSVITRLALTSGGNNEISNFEWYFDTQNNLYLQGQCGSSSTNIYTFYGFVYLPNTIHGISSTAKSNVILKANLVYGEAVVGYTGTWPVVYFHYIVDGKYIAKIRSPQRILNTTNQVEFYSRGPHAPSIGSSSRNAGQVAITNPYGYNTWFFPFTGKISNFFFANYDFNIPTTCIPKYLADGYANPTLTLNPAWTTNSEFLFPMNKALDPAVEDESKFIVYTQVINAGIVRSFAKYLVDFTLPDPTTGQKIEVSYRLSNNQFASDNTSVAWSAWNDVTSLNKVYVILSGMYGQYAQMRLKLTPDSISRQAVPVINETEFWVVNGPNITFDKFFMVL